MTKMVRVDLDVYIKLAKLKYDLMEKHKTNLTLSNVIEMLILMYKEEIKSNETK